MPLSKDELTKRTPKTTKHFVKDRLVAMLTKYIDQLLTNFYCNGHSLEIVFHEKHIHCEIFKEIVEIYGGLGWTISIQSKVDSYVLTFC